MITRHEHGKVTWVDLESPTHDELRSIMREFSIDARIEEEMVSPTPYPLHAFFPDYAYVVLHFPSPIKDGETHDIEIDLVIGKQFLVTCRYVEVPPLHNLHKLFEAEELLHTYTEDTHADTMLARVLGKFYSAIRDELERSSRTLAHIERNIFDNQERAMVRSISDVGRQLLHFSTVLDRQEETVVTFLKLLHERKFFGDSFIQTRESILLEHTRATHLVNSNRAVAAELRETNDSLLSAKQNDIMKKLTVITFIVMPLTLIASLFTMPVTSTPIIGLPHDFWIILFIMVLCSGFSALFVLRKRWL